MSESESRKYYDEEYPWLDQLHHIEETLGTDSDEAHALNEAIERHLKIGFDGHAEEED